MSPATPIEDTIIAASPDTDSIGSTDDPQAGGLFSTGSETILSGIDSSIIENTLLAKASADASINAAKTSETNAATSATNAATSATNAATSATNANTSATNAAASAQAASDSADAAGRIGGKDIPETTPTNSVFLKFSNADDAWVYSSEIDAGTFS